MLTPHNSGMPNRCFGLSGPQVLVLYRERSGEKDFGECWRLTAGAFSIQRLEGSRLWNLRAMYFEFQKEDRKLATGRMYCRWAFRLVVGPCISGLSQPRGGQRGNTCGDRAGRGAEAVMRKIESWPLPGEKGRRPPSKLYGAESFDKDRGPAALGTNPKRPWSASGFFRRLSFEKPT